VRTQCDESLLEAQTAIGPPQGDYDELRPHVPALRETSHLRCQSPLVEDKAAWSAAGGIVTGVTAAAAFVSPLWPMFGAFAVVGFYWVIAPLLCLWPWSRWDGKARLRACYRDGRVLQILQKTLAQYRSLDPEEAETQARYSACRWAERTWKVLKQHFPGHEQDFFGPGKMVLAETPAAFDLYCENEIERFGSADSFLEQKLQDIGNLLRMDGPQ